MNSDPGTRHSELRKRRLRSFRRSAFTLLEISLTLLIAGVLVAAIAAAVNIHLRVVDAGRGEVEQAQLARALLRRIADDLRNAVPIAADASTESAEDEAAAALAAGSASGAGTATGASGGGSAYSGSSSGVTTLSAASASSSVAQDAASRSSSQEEDLAVVPGLRGTQYELQIDVCRPPRLTNDSLSPTSNSLGGLPGQPLADVQTVSYFVTGVASAGMGGGLVRRQLAQQAAAYSASLGGLDASLYERLLASEATGLEFRFYDGSQWLTEWDSTESGALPSCIEVVLMLAPSDADSATGWFSTNVAVVEPTAYRLLVHLPAAGVATAADDSSSAETETP